MAEFSTQMMREMQRQRKAAAKQSQQPSRVQGSSLAQFQALYDADEKLMAGNSVDASGLDPQQFNLETERAGNALLVSLKNSGHQLTTNGLKKFIDYVQHHHIGQTVLDTRRADVLCAAFNRASQIGLFEPSDFVSGVPAQTAPKTGRDREDADRAEYLRDLRAEIGEVEFRKRQMNQQTIAATKVSNY